MLTFLHPELAVYPVPYQSMGVWFGRQLVVVRLPHDQVWIHSPVPWTAGLRGEVAALGDVRHVVGPNRLHDECLREFQQEYPEATFHAAPGLAADRRDLRFASAPLGDQALPPWQGVLEQHLVKGMPRLNEVVFFHRASRSLILADLAFDLETTEGPWFSRLALRLSGAWGRFTPSRLCRTLMRDRAAVHASIETILAWDFDRIIAGHGRNIPTNGKTVFRDAFAFLSK